MDEVLVLLRENVCRYMDCRSLARLACTHSVFRECSKHQSRLHVKCINRRLRKLAGKGDVVYETLARVDRLQDGLYWWFCNSEYPSFVELYGRLRPYRDSHNLPYSFRELLPTLLQYHLARTVSIVKDLLYESVWYIWKYETCKEPCMIQERKDQRDGAIARYLHGLEASGYYRLQDISGYCTSKTLTKSSIFIAGHLFTRHADYGQCMKTAAGLVAQCQALVAEFDFRVGAFKNYRLILEEKAIRLVGDERLRRIIRRFTFRDPSVTVVVWPASS